MTYGAGGKWLSNVFTNHKILIRHVLERAPLHRRGERGVRVWKRDTMELEDIAPVTLFT